MPNLHLFAVAQSYMKDVISQRLIAAKEDHVDAVCLEQTAIVNVCHLSYSVVTTNPDARKQTK